MSITTELPADVEALLCAKAEAVRNGGFRRLGEVDAEPRAWHGLPDLSSLSPEKGSAVRWEVIAHIDPRLRNEWLEPEPMG